VIRRSTATAVARAANALFFLMTSAYCVLSYNSFAYYQFIRPEVFAWPGDFVALHHVFFWLMLLVTAATLVPHAQGHRGPRAAWASRAYLGVTGIAGVGLVVHPLMEGIDLSGRSLAIGLIVLAFPLSLAAVDHLIAPAASMDPATEARLVRACGLTGLAVWAAYAIAAPYRLHRAAGIDLPFSAVVIGLVSSGVAHLVVFSILLLVLAFALGIARFARLGASFEYWVFVAGAAAALAFILDTMAFGAVGFAGIAAWSAASALGATIAIVWSGIARHRAADRGDRIDALDAFLAPLHIGPAIARRGLFILLPAAAFGLAAAVEKLDWDFLLQKLSVLVVWLVAFSLMYARSAPGVSGSADNARDRGVLAVPAGVLALFWVASLGGARLVALTGDARLNPEFVLDRYAAVDPSFHLIQDAARSNSGEARRFYGYLKANTTISHVNVDPIEIDFVKPLGPPPGERPHIFLFVVDSLRRDYTTPYNPRVTFTPAIDRFARESFVFDRAFTRYGATGLSVPAMWIGGMTLHMQYIRPFTPMNTLMKLLDAAGYRRMMGMDTIAVRILAPTPMLTEIDRGIPTEDYDLCRTLREMSAKLEGGEGRHGPVFGYTLPQNVHIANAFETPVPAGESYPGFFERVAAVTHRIDACFGSFVDRLKALGLYDRSIIILTSDHGDSLGEDGRYGHSYTVFPEVMRVPLIVHLPESMRGLPTDLTRVAFLTDITPTLYSLLGYRPADLGSRYGTPLFGRTPDESWRRRDPFVLTSSYGAVYGMLRHNGRFLYIADAVEGRDYAYDLSDGGLGSRVEITEAMRTLNWTLIRREVAAIAAEYRYTPEQ
jgi:hypothetical protein